MKLTSFYPLIVTSHGEEVKHTLASLGFEVAHVKTDFAAAPTKNTVLKDADGRRVEVSEIADMIKAAKDTVMIRANVDNLEEAVETLGAQGFTVVARDTTSSAEYCMVSAPSGLTIDLCKHIKK